MIVLQRAYVEDPGLLGRNGLGYGEDTGKRRIMRDFMQQRRLADRL